MKAITLYQPWASLIAIGAKKIETCSWRTSYRGLLAIHAAKKFPKEAQELCLQDPFASILIEYGLFKTNIKDLGLHLPLGKVIAHCKLAGIGEISDFNNNRDGKDGWLSGGKTWRVSKQELAFGDYAPGRYAWLLDEIRAIDPPVIARGYQGLWEWEWSKTEEEIIRIEGNRYKFRSECQFDIDRLFELIPGDNLIWWKIEPEPGLIGLPDRVCELELSGLMLDDLKEIMAKIEDGHVMLETVEELNDYTGDRN